MTKIFKGSVRQGADLRGLFWKLIPKKDGSSDPLQNAWMSEVWQVYSGDKLVYHKPKTFANCWTTYRLIRDNYNSGVGVNHITPSVGGRWRTENPGVKIPLIEEQEKFLPNLYYGSGTPALGKFLRFYSSLPEGNESHLANLQEYTKKYPITGKEIGNLCGGSQHLGGFGVGEFEKVGNKFPGDGKLDITVKVDPASSLSNSLNAFAAFAYAKVNPVIRFESGAITNCTGMFRGTRGVTQDPRRLQYEVYFSPMKLEVDLKGKPVNSDPGSFHGFIPYTIDECFKFGYYSQKAFDAFFENAKWKHCRSFQQVFAESVFNRVFDDEDGSDAAHTYTSGGLRYAEMVVKSPKGMAPYTEHADNTWTPNQGPWDDDYVWNSRWGKDYGSLARLCFFSCVREIHCIIDCKYLWKDSHIEWAFKNTPSTAEWGGYRGRRCMIKEVRLKNLGNRHWDFSDMKYSRDGGWGSSNTGGWVLNDLSEASIVYLLDNMRDQSGYEVGKENKLFLLGKNFSIRVPTEWEKYLTKDRLKELTRKGWLVFVGDSKVAVNGDTIHITTI